MPIENDNIVLRAPEPADITYMFLLENDTDLWTDGAAFAPLSHHQIRDYVNNYDGNIFSARQLRLIIEPRSTQEKIGIIDLYDYDNINNRAYVGIVISKNFRNKRYGRQAIALISGYCRYTLGLNQLSAIVRVGNEASLRLFTAAGFTQSGILKEWIKSCGNFHDAHFLQLLLNHHYEPVSIKPGVAGV